MLGDGREREEWRTSDSVRASGVNGSGLCRLAAQRDDVVQIGALVQLARIDHKVLGHPAPVLRIKVEECAALQRAVLLVQVAVGHTCDPHLLLHVIPPVAVVPVFGVQTYK